MVSTPGLNVYVGGEWVGMRFETSGLKHSTGFYVEESAEGSPSPSGDLRASVTLSCDRDFQASWLTKGKAFRFYEYGTLGWGGLISEIERDADGVTIHAEGLGSELKNWDAVYDADPTSAVDEQPTFIPNTALDYAISLGAPFIRGEDLGTTSLQAANDGPLTDLLTLLQRAAVNAGKRLHVDSAGVVTFKATPTTPKWMMTPQADYFSTADDSYRSLLRGYFIDKDKYAYLLEIVGSPTGGSFQLEANGNQSPSMGLATPTGSWPTAIRTLGGVFTHSDVSFVATNQFLVSARGPGDLRLYSNSLTGGTDPTITITPIAGRSVVKAEDAAAAAKFGVKHGRINLEGLGPITKAQAQSYINGRFALVGGRMGWTNQVELNTDNLLRIADDRAAWASPRYVKAGDMLMITGIIDSRSDASTRGSIQWVIQEVEVTEADDGGDPTALVTPVGFAPRDVDGLLAPPENPANREAA